MAYIGYLYTCHSSRANGTVNWRCVQRQRKCYGSVNTDVGYTHVRVVSQHNHPADYAAVDIAVCRQNMNVRAEMSRDKPSVIYAEGVKNLSTHARARLHTSEAIKRTLRNHKTVHLPPVPKTLNDLSIAGEWTTTGGLNSQPFLFFDNGVGSRSRIIAFGTDDAMKVLANSASWYMDGNFAMAPKLFLQVSQGFFHCNKVQPSSVSAKSAHKAISLIKLHSV